MLRLHKAASPVAVMAGLLAVILASAGVQARGQQHRAQPASGRPWSADAVELARTAPEAIQHGTAATSCTGWRSTYQPPPTIRVLRTRGPQTGSVETVDFRVYVGWVLSTEWTSSYPLEAFKVGAVAVKQYGWYFTVVYRGGVDATGNCYDVVDDTNDQYYDPDAIPARPGPNRLHLQAIANTWNISLRKWSTAAGTSRMFLTGYRSGRNVPCGQERDGFRLYQRSVYNCAVAPSSLTYEQILRIYLNPNLEIVNPGAHNVIGSSQGDVTALTPGNGTSLRPRIYQRANLQGLSPAGTSALSIASTGLLDAASQDMNGDGRQDLLTLVATGPTSARVDVALSDGATDYLPAAVWSAATDLRSSVQGARLLTGDFNADGRADAGILLAAPPLPPAGGGAPEPQAQLLVMLQRKTGAAAEPSSWWSGPLDLSNASAWAGDINGDGATDLLLGQDSSVPGPTPTGVHFAAALSAPPTAGLARLATWFDAPDLSLKGMLATVGDSNRDGFDDLFVVFTSAAGPTQIDAIRGNGRRVSRTQLWAASSADPMPLARLKLTSADINFDGLEDIVLLRNRGADGTALVVLRGGYKKLNTLSTFTDATLNWSTARPY